MFKELFQNRKLIAVLAGNELRTRYLGTFAGFLWAIINPTIMALIYWFIFSSIFYSGKVHYGDAELPYICYFLAGYAPWLLFLECVSRSVNSIVENPNYVKKILFPLPVLAPIQFLASSVAHGVILCVLFAIMAYDGIPFSAHLLLLIPYYLVLMALTLGVSWLVSALNVFIRDTAQVVAILLNVWFWFCPIVWVFSSMPQKYYPIFRANPFIFIIEGYRRALFGDVVMPSMQDSANWPYLLVILLVLIGGHALFNRLKNHFSDVV